METNRTLRAIVVCLVIFSILAAACGQAQTSAETNPPGQAPATETQAPQALVVTQAPVVPTETVQPSTPAAEAPTETAGETSSFLDRGGVKLGQYSTQIVDSLTLLTGSDTEPSKYSSYHLEYSWSGSFWDRENDAPVDKQETISADVEGNKIYLVHTAVTGQDKKATEGYSIGDQAYEVQDGKVEESLFGITLVWLSWTLDPIITLGMASMDDAKPQAVTYEGLAAQKFDLDTARVDPATMKLYLALPGFLTDLTSVKGTTWIDADNHALLKAVFDFEQVLLDKDQKPHNTHPGHMEIVVSKIGAVKVSLP